MFRVVIPARFASTRLPGKPLLPLAGKPMIQWVYERARRSSARQVIVATDDERIARLVRELGGEAYMTSAEHSSGTDRIAEIARRERWHEGEIVVNLQGDEPLMPEALLDPNVVKVVVDAQQRALYFSRAPIPWSRDGAEGALGQRRYIGAQRHLGLYAYRVSSLLRLAALPPSPLEQIEKLEQLRALEHGMDVRVAHAVIAPGPDVNTAEDLSVVAALLETRR